MSDDVANVAVLSSLMGRLEKAVEQSFAEINRRIGDHAHRLTKLEEAQIRAEERSRAEDRLRQALREERQSGDEESNTRVTLSLARWQVVVAVLTVLVMLAGVAVAAVQAFS